MAEEHENHTSTSQQQFSSSSSSSSASSYQKSPQEPLNKQTQLPSFHGSPLLNYQMLQSMYPRQLPGAFNTQPIQEELNRGPGLYAVPVAPFMGQYGGFPPNTLIPFTYTVPSGPSTPENGTVGEEQGRMGQQQQQQPLQQQPGPQRQIVVRRFQIAFQLDILLILKLAAVIFLFNQDGSRQRLVLLVFLASLVYLYQTGALAPLVRWLSQGMQRAAAPPQPPRPAVRADNLPAAGRQGDANVAAGVGGENENEQGNGINRVAENEHAAEAGGGNRWWGIAKEIQMIVFGFITSLLPGFHNID